MGRRIMNKVSKSKPKTSFSFYRNSNDPINNSPSFDPITLEQLETETLTVREFIDERMKRQDWRHEFMMKGSMACAVTSTGVDAVLVDERRALTPTEMFKEIFLRVKVEKQKMKVRFEAISGKGVVPKHTFFEIGNLLKIN